MSFPSHTAVFAALALAAAGAGCRTTVSSSPPGAENAFVTRGEATQAWEVSAGGAAVGFLVRYEELRTGRVWFSVRNLHQQEAGIVDADGRAWRHRPHETEPVWIGTGTVRNGIALILGTESETNLADIALDDLAARPLR